MVKPRIHTKLESLELDLILFIILLVRQSLFILLLLHLLGILHNDIHDFKCIIIFIDCVYVNNEFICILDLPVILSQNYCGFLEPQERVWKGESGIGFYLEKLQSKYQEALEPFDGICGFSKHNPSYQDKTLFRFPLRTRESNLSSDVYTIDKLHSLLHTLKEEAQYLLVFLRSVCSIEICKITESNDTLSLFKVSVSQRDYQSRLSQQKQLISRVESTFTGQSQYSVRDIIKDASRFNIEKVDGGTVSNYDWLVVNQIGSNDDDVMQLAEKQHILPWVGTAINLNDPISNGRIFCVLPLPVEDQAPFHVHVNGTFAISSNRRSLKWEAQERKGDEEGTWNKLLVEKCLPSCYFKLVSELMELLVDPSTVYSCWPDIKRVNGTPWSGILDPFYQLLVSNSKAVHTSSVSGGRWISVRDAVFIADEVPVAVNDAMIKCNVNLVKINNSCSEALKQYHNLKTLQPGLVRSHLKSNAHSYCNASRQEKLEILKYILKDDAFHDIIGLQLLPLANGTFQQFQNKSRYVDDIFVSSSSYPSSLLPGLESQLVSVYNEDSTLHSQLCSVVGSSYTQLVLLNTEQVANLLSKCNTSHWSRDQMSHFWQWLDNKQLSYFQSKPIVPVKSDTGGTSVTALAKQDGVVYISPYNHVASAALLSGLEKCGIRFADARDFSYLKHNQLSQYLYQFENDQVLDAMHSLYLNSVSFSSTEAVALQNFLKNSRRDHKKISTLCKIPLFKALQYNESSRVSINTIRTSYCDNKAIAMSGTYSFRTDFLTNSPLIIDVAGNVSSLLQHLSGHVYLMQETEYLQKVAFQQIRNRQFSNSNIVPFMISVLDNFYSPQYRQSANQLTFAMSSLPFVEVSNSSTLDTPQNLFDPEIEILLQLYNGENKFPSSSFHSYLPILRQCGLKSSVNGNEIFQILSSLRSRAHYSTSSNVGQVKFSRILSVLKYLSDNPHLFNNYIKGYGSKLLAILCNQASQYCWLPVASNPPSNYPSSLIWNGSQYSTCLVSSGVSPLVVLFQDLSTSELPLIVGSQAIFVENTPHQLSQNFISHPMSLVPAVISHFNQVILHKDKISGDMLQSISFKTYTYLQQNISYCNPQLILDKWIWLESRSTFIDSSQVAVAGNPSFRSSLEPFIFVLPSNLQKFSSLFIRCGVPDSVTASQILSVLKSIQDQSGGSQITNDNAWSIVRAILDWIADDTDRMSEGNALIPIESDSSYPQLLPIEDVSYTDNEMLRDIANASDEEYNLMHPKVTYLVPILGITPLSDHLDITEDVFDDAGQHEPLTTRLGNILREYKDGLTIIKEMIQNADDAGATEVNILFDNRTHSTQKLLFKGMAESHGPALIVHNNSTFTKEDFENITKLAGATKANQPLKIGKFGVGFCSVYHITDVPSFVSGEWLYIFDPTLKYLKGVVHNESRPGKKVKYQSKFLAQSQQMAPYEGLFGFTSSANYNGTIFRLPFRTSASQISSTIYNEYLIQKMKNDLIENGSKLLLFLQNVKRITFRSMQGDEVCISSINEENGIKHTITNSPANNSVSEYWLVSCQEEKLQAQAGDYQPGTASVACQLVKEDSSFECKPVQGSVFCFLPLSLLPCTGLPVHVNANFAVMSDRSRIWTEASSGEPSDSREYWNKKLMTTIIPKAYCNLLKMLKEMYLARELRSYEFYALWPLITKLRTSYPWEDMVLVLIHLIANEKCFYSSVVSQWFSLASSQFLPLSLFEIEVQTCSVFIEAAKILKLPLILLPQDHVEQLPNAIIISEDQFSQAFFDNISVFSDYISTRNEILSAMLSVIGNGTAVPDNYKKLENVLVLHPCVPTSPDGLKLKLAEELVDLEEFCDMFDPEDGMFPQKSLYEHTLVREGIFRLGLMSISKVSWEVIICSAKTVKPLIDTEEKKALDRIKIIIECIEEKEDPAPLIINEISFLPVFPKPDKYFLPWKGDTHRLLPPSQMIAKEYSLKKTSMLLGSQKAIINTTSEGCGTVSTHSLELIGVPLHPSFDDVHNHFICLMNELDSSMSDDLEKIQLTEEICKLVYAYFESKITNSTSVTGKLLTSKKSNQNPDSLRCKEILAEYCDKPFVWNGKCFVCPCDVSINWKQSEGPYLYKLPGILSQHKELVNCLQIKENFSTVKLLGILSKMYANFSPTCEIPESCHETADNIISDLNALHKEDLEENAFNAILFDKNYILRPTNELAFNDAAWLPPDNESNYVPSLLAREVALALGVQPTKSKFLEKYISPSQNFSGVPFGQREKLTLRIRNILEDYPLDVTFLKELLQNADDAKATKMCVILDKRHHTAEKIPFKNGNDLNGPAILVWDDKDFTDENLKGIQELGLGSKRDDNESVGQFGIGFNAVYHVTDCPSLYTRGNTLCVFDPHCKYIPGADELNPGRQLSTDKFFWDNMSDLRSFFLQDDFPDKPQNLDSGVLFRFPLRCTEEQVMNSELVDHEKAKPLTSDKMEELLKNWMVNIKESLLFLNHIIQFEYYVIESSGKVKCERSYSVELDGDSLEKRKKLKASFASPFLVTYPMILKTNLDAKNSLEEHWLIQQGVGDIQNPNKNWNTFNTKYLPKHGLAAASERSSNFKGQVFCFLPLPVLTDLPVHINGQFCLVSNRRSLWVSTTEEPDDKTKWNESLIKAIASSYAQFLEKAKRYYFTLDRYDNLDELFDAANRYYSLFPFWDPPFIYKKKEEKPETAFRSSGSITRYSGIPKPKVYPIAKRIDWKGICSLVFKLIWNSNAHLLATEVKKKTFSKNDSNSKRDVLWTVEWHQFHNDSNPKNQAYFQSNTLQKVQKKVLRHLGMILTCAPHALYSHIQSEEVKPAILSRQSVYEYYCNFSSQIIMKCPCPITETPFESVDNFLIFLTYLLECFEEDGSLTYVFPSFPNKLPLLLTADSQLRAFNTPSTVVCSKYSHIFEKSSFMFLHPDIIGKKLSGSYFSSELSLDAIATIMNSNFKLALQSLEVDNTNQDVIKEDELRGLWFCLKDDPIFSKNVSYIVERWAIIPAKSGHLFSAKSPILPLNIESLVDNSVFSKLVSLGIPKFDSMYSSCLAVKYCINPENYCEVLSILYHLHQKTQVLSNLRDVKKTIQILFDYFGRINFKHEPHSLKIIKSLPLFEEVDGNLTSLSNKVLHCWPSEASLTGYDEWNFSGSFVFLPANGPWTTLCSDITTLGGSNLTERDLYIKFIFPNFKLLSSENRKEHLKHIKDTMFNYALYESESDHVRNSRHQSAVEFLEELKQLPCLEAKNGVLQPIRAFCDHNMAIFNVFPEHFYFVPEEYKDNDEWLKFLKKLDLKVTVTIAVFESFAKLVESGRHENISKASEVLVSYLFSDSAKEWHQKPNILSRIKCIRFVEVSNLDNLEWVKKSCKPPLYLVNQSIGLTMLNEAVIYDSAALIWTVKPVINLPVPPYLWHNSEQYNLLQKNLGVILRPKVEDVLMNLENISQTDLAKFDLFHKYDSRYNIREDSHRVEIKDIIEQSLSYLFECEAEEQLIKLKCVSCIPVLASRNQPVLVKPLQVVRYIPDDCPHFFPYLHKLPSFLMGFEEVKHMGISDNITVKTLQYLLMTMHEQLSNNLDRNTQTTVREAIIELHKLLQKFQYSKKNIIEDISPLYFPNQDGILVKTTDLVFIDSHRYRRTEKKFDFSHSQYSLFILPPPAQNSSSTIMYDSVSMTSDVISLRLPKDVRPKGISLICREELIDDTKASDNNSPLYLHFMALKSIATALKAILSKIVMGEFDDGTQTRVDECKIDQFVPTLVDSFITNIEVIIIKNLKCHVIVDEEIIATIQAKYLFQKGNDNFILYVDTNSNPSSYWVRKEIAHTLCVETARMNSTDLTSYLKFSNIICECLAAQSFEDLEPILEKYKIKSPGFEILCAIESNPARLGGKIPDHRIDLLENDINHIFFPEEWVGFLNDEGNFIYVVVCYLVEQEVFNPLTKKYVINVDENDETEVVSTLDLYKLTKVGSRVSLEKGEDTNQELVVFDADSASARTISDSDTVLQLKRAIFCDLRLIDGLKDEDEKRKAIKRLYKQYHPDRNSDNVAIYEEAFKFLKRQVDRLYEGKELEDPDKAIELLIPTGSSSKPNAGYWGKFYEEWDEDIRRQKRANNYARERSHKMREDDFFPDISQPMPNSDEANFWIIQAESDLEAMLLLNEQIPFKKVQCQVLFQAHEACEKALKAGKYKLVGLNPASLKTHELHTHAAGIAGYKGGEWKVLPSLVHQIEEYYLKPRYPNKHSPSKAPVDVYSKCDEADNVQEAVENAKKLVELIRKLF